MNVLSPNRSLSYLVELQCVYHAPHFSFCPNYAPSFASTMPQLCFGSSAESREYTLRERSHMTSARFCQILPPPPSCQQLSALSDPPPDDVSICQTPPFQRTPYIVH